MTPLIEAHHVYTNRAHYPTATLVEAAASLAEHGIFSRRAIVAITGLSYRQVAKVVTKTDRSGGRLNPEVLGDLVRLAEARDRGQMDVFAAQRALSGTSASFASRLTGVPISTLARWAKRAGEL